MPFTGVKVLVWVLTLREGPNEGARSREAQHLPISRHPWLRQLLNLSHSTSSAREVWEVKERRLNRIRELEAAGKAAAKYGLAVVEVIVLVRYRVPEMWVSAPSLGWSTTFELNGYDVTIGLPAGVRDYSRQEPGAEDVEVASATVVQNAFVSGDVDPRTAAVHIFEVGVAFDANVPATKPEDPSDEFRVPAEAALAEGMKVANDAAHMFLRWTRANARQSWLGLVETEPVQYAVAGIHYRSTGERLFGLGPTRTSVVRSSMVRLELAELDEIGRSLSMNRDVPIALSLLADAWHLSEGSDASEEDRAILLAAIACEVQAKTLMQSRVSADRHDLLAMVLHRRSNLPELLDEVARAGFGVSLKVSNPDLFERVVALSGQRNSIVHTGRQKPSGARVHRPAQTASEVFDWLDVSTQL